MPGVTIYLTYSSYTKSIERQSLSMSPINRIIVVCIYLLFFTIQLNAQNKVEPTFDIDQIEKEIDHLLSQYKKKEPGIAIGIIEQNKLVLQKQIGLANIEHQIPITDKTSFHVASVSKQFTAFAILQLEDQGQLSLDDDIRKYLPEMHAFEKTITIKNLLNHTSGIKDQWNLLRLSGWRLNDFIDHKQVLNILFNQTSLNFEPNEKFMYSNSGYTLLAEIVSRVSKMPFSAYTKKNIFIPLEMHHTQFVDQKGQIINNKSSSYYKEGENYVEDVFNNTSVGATNLSTTVEDLSKWAINFNTKKVGSHPIFKKMNTQEKLKNGKLNGYAYGQFMNTYKGVKRIEHSGQDASYQAYLARFPDLNISLIFMNNNSEIDGGKLARQLTDICLSGYVEQNQNNSSSKSLLTHEKPIVKKVSELKPFEGHYWNEEDKYSRQIKIQNDTLYYIRNDKDKTALIPVGENKFEMNLEEYVGVSFKANQMIVTLDDGYQIVLDSYTPANHNSNTLKEFKGSYYSPELNTYYTLSINENKLTANHYRLGDFKLKAIKNDYFIGSKGSFRKVVFLRNESGKITGFNVSGSRAKNVLFNKVME